MEELITAALIEADLNGDDKAVADLLKLSKELEANPEGKKGADGDEPPSEKFQQ